MVNYIAFIRKADFLDLYRYGILHVNRDMICPFTCTIEELKERQTFLNNITAFANSFDNSFSYLFIHYIKSGVPSRTNDVMIEEVLGIYPLDYEAKRNLEMIDEKIHINNPLWADASIVLQKHQTKMSCKQGTHNLWRIFDIEAPIEKYASMVTTDIVREVVEELFNNQRPSGALHPLVYLLRYERHSYYPKNTIGFFLDAVNVMFNIIGGKEVEEEQISSSMIYMYLMHLLQSGDYKFDAIITSIEQEPKVQAIVNKSKELLPGYDFIKVAVLYLTFKSKSQDGLFYNEEWIRFGKSFGDDFYLACYLLGINLGHEHTSDCLYEMIQLPILKKKAPITSVEIKNEVPTDNKEENSSDKTNETKLEEEQKEANPISGSDKRTESPSVNDLVGENKQEVEEEPKTNDSYPKEMVLLNKNGKINRKSKPITVNTPEEEAAYIKKGYSVKVKL